jgi:ribosomal protein S27AE
MKTLRDSDDLMSSILGRPFCPECGCRMWLVSITPAEAGFDERMFECPRCGSKESITLKRYDTDSLS